ncbi:MAG: hypothetical protein RAO94_03925, partial [Candidatus Stygibacter australis]|nr:hypothetical protein [Candidatus Stygibacter australis]
EYQDYLNKEIPSCEIIVFLFHKVYGKHTREEYELALENFKAGKMPHYIYVCFKEVNLKRLTDIDKNILELNNLSNEIVNDKQIFIDYSSTTELKKIMSKQFDLILPEIADRITNS